VTFHSMLFERPEQRVAVDPHEPPACFQDLNLDQVVESVTAAYEEYQLKPYFYAPLRDVDAITYRHEIFRDLEGQALWECIDSFAQQMRSMRAHLAQADKLHYQYQRERWFLDAVGIYCDAVSTLQHDLASLDIHSRGLLAFRRYLSEYVCSPTFTSLQAERSALDGQLAAIIYSLHIQDNRITVSRYDREADYAAEVEETFQKFRQGHVKDYRTAPRSWPEMNHVESGVLDRVALLYPDIFQALDSFYQRHQDYLDPAVVGFDRDIQFYVSYLEFTHRLSVAGLQFCYPSVSARSKEVSASETFDLALANKLVPQQSPVVCNDFHLQEPERIFVVTGPNQGGKTTFARTFGQLHYLASIGCPVPGKKAHLFLFDSLFTHFEREEHVYNLRGKLEDDLIRIHGILQHATPNSIVIMNEIFTSTTLRDALFLGTKVLRRLTELGLLGVCVTFVDELSTLNEATVSMVSTVIPEDPTIRTYKVVRKPADGRAYAAAIAEKYGLTYERVKERIAP
jgi:DNA mismatch repair protein MutS